MLPCSGAEGDLSQTQPHKHFAGDARTAASYRSRRNGDTAAPPPNAHSHHDCCSSILHTPVNLSPPSCDVTLGFTVSGP